MNRSMIIKTIGTVATVVSLASSLVSNWCDAEKMDIKIDEKINKALALKAKELEKES